jgi:two-component system chemotaxis sensor kinase CheA
MREKQPIILFHNGPDETFGLSLSLITRIEKIRTSEIERVGEKEFIQYRGGALRIYRLDKTLNVSKPTTIPEFLHVIVPKTLRAPAGIVATEVVDVKEIDVKLDRTNVKTPGILGSSIIDGRLSLMLDVLVSSNWPIRRCTPKRKSLTRPKATSISCWLRIRRFSKPWRNPTWNRPVIR